jgi:alkanesulfonate monooxygenase SsuD/methylene tetrahydromethanopterin reductase-like flavin-dependent oxidoreductase (luciferase family)
LVVGIGGREERVMMKLGLFLAEPGQHVVAWRDPAVAPDAGQAREFYEDLKRRAASCGRPPNAIKIMPGVMAVVGRSKG